MIAIIGQPGSGKSYTIKLLKKKGYKILIADEFFTKQYEKNNMGYQIIKDNLGAQYINDKQVIREEIRKYAINNMSNLEKLVHPLLEEHLKNNKYDFVEIPIIYSKHANFVQYFSAIINIVNSKKLISKELLRRNMNDGFHSLIVNRTKNKNLLKTIDIYSGNFKKIMEFKHKI